LFRLGVAMFAVLAPGALVAPSARAAEYYVSPGGSDSDSGTLDHPWRTIQKAANAATTGSTVHVRAGTYFEKVTFNVSGSADGPITFRNYKGESAVLDGTGVSGEDMMRIRDRQYLRIIGFEICNNKAASSSAVPRGILIDGYGAYLEIRNCKIHHMECANARSADGHGLAVYGDNGRQSIDHLVIDGNEVRDCKLGTSEALVLNGNVENFEVTNNYVHHHNNIGIDFIGFEGTSPDVGTDQARHGLCRGNTVHDIDSYGNPGYGKERSADGIYVDGGRDIVIERNLVYRCNFGIEIGCEHRGKTTSGVTVRDNVVYACDNSGIIMGGYDARRGSVAGCQFLNNTLYKNNTLNEGCGEIDIQHHTSDCQIRNNLVYVAHNAGGGAFGSYVSGAISNVVWDYNLWYGQGGAEKLAFHLPGRSYGSFSAWQGSGHDGHSVFADPKLAAPAAHPADVHLQADSPARNAGEPGFSPGAGETDLDGEPRVCEGRVDCGADEYAVFSAARRAVPAAGGAE